MGSRNRVWILGTLLIAAGSTAHLILLYPELPARVPIHFNAAGVPDGWTDRANFLALQIGLTLFLLGLGFGSAMLVRVLPAQLINLPYRDFWLAPDRRVATEQTLFRYMLVFTIFALLLFWDLMFQSIQVAVGNAKTLDHGLGSVGVFLAATLVWCGALLWRFRRRPDGEASFHD